MRLREPRPALRSFFANIHSDKYFHIVQLFIIEHRRFFVTSRFNLNVKKKDV